MRIARFEAGPWPRLTGWRSVLFRALGLVLPRANPDLEPVYEHVTHWWLEVDDTGLVRREVAFDDTGRAIAAAPLGDNRGIFTDLDSAPDPLGESVQPADFEQAWKDVRGRFDPSKPGAGLV
jgi:hypothetical protein